MSNAARAAQAMDITVRQIRIEDAESFRECLDAVARERRFLAQVEALPLVQVQAFVRSSVDHDAAQYVAIADERVVGWCDILAHWAHALRHVGSLGMGVHADFRGQGLGERLLRTTIAHAVRNGIYRVTAEARTDNVAAIGLYEKLGFRHEAHTRCALRFDGTFYDGVQMALLQGPASAA